VDSNKLKEKVFNIQQVEAEEEEELEPKIFVGWLDKGFFSFFGSGFGSKKSGFLGV